MNKYLSITLIALFSAAIASSCTGKEFGGQGFASMSKPGKYEVEIKGRISIDWENRYYVDKNFDGMPDMDGTDTLWVYQCTAFDTYGYSADFLATKGLANSVKSFSNDNTITLLSLSVYDDYVGFSQYTVYRNGSQVIGGKLSGEVNNIIATAYQRQ
jgi:hypothetical protein